MINKIKSVQQDGTWNSKHDGSLNYTHEYEFEDGTILQASHKTQQPFRTGDEVEYEVKKENQYGKSGTVKWVKNYPNSPSNKSNKSNKSNDKVQGYIIRQSSLTRAIEHLKVNEPSQNLTKENVIALAEYYEKWVLR